MKPFRTSATARVVSLSIAFALIGGGLIPILGLAPSLALPVVLLIAVGGCIVGGVLGVNEHTGPTAALAIFLPLLLWPFVMLLISVSTRHGEYGWALIAAGAVVSGATAVASFTTRADERASSTQHA